MSETTPRHVDNVLQALGPIGKYQLLQMISAASINFPTAWQLLGGIFISQLVPFHCAEPASNSSLVGLKGNKEYINVTYGECDILVTSNTTVLLKEDCVYGIEYERPVDASVISQFDLVCDKSPMAKLSQTVLFAGQGFGAVIATIISDRFGRKKVLAGSNFGLLVCGLILAYAPNYILFVIFKFMLGGFQQGCVTSAVTFVQELFPTKYRRINAAAGGLLWAIGTTTLALISYLLKDYSWRTLQMALSMSSAVAVIQLWFLDESLRWLIANGKSEEALRVIKRAAKINKKDVDMALQAYQRPLDETKPQEMDVTGQTERQVSPISTTIAKEATRKLTIFELFRNRRLLINSCVMWFAWFTTALSYFALYLTSTSLVGDIYLNYFLTALMEVPSNLFLYFGLNRIGRKGCTMVTFALVTVGLISAGFFKYMEPEGDFYYKLTTAASLVAMLGCSGSFGVIFNYTPELFPTNLRNQALGVSSFIGRVGAMLAPFAGDLAGIAAWAPGLLIGCCALAVFFLVTVLPETADKELPQTMEELQIWYTKIDDKGQNLKDLSHKNSNNTKL